MKGKNIICDNYDNIKVVSINFSNFGSTGKIIREICKLCQDTGSFSTIFVSNTKQNRMVSEKDCNYIGFRFSHIIHTWLSRLTGLNGFFQIISTWLFILKLKKIAPDVIHLHNLHNSYINLPIVFDYIKKHQISVIWTLHDCWSFTGHCPYFDIVHCDKWKTGCYSCLQYREYPQSFVDNSKVMWKLKKKWFTGVENMTIVTPSQWLADLVKQSFLKDYPVRVINNGIDLSVFKPTSSDFRTKHNIPNDKHILLGVAFGWGVRKGLDVFIELSKRLDAEKYQIVLVGTGENIDKHLPDNILSIHRTQNQQELAEIYTAADLFVNTTREEVFGLVNVEALACGTPGITFNTGGSPECYDSTCGSVVHCDDVDAMEKEIIRICETEPFTKEACLERAKTFDMNERFREYVDLYREVLNDRTTEKGI